MKKPLFRRGDRVVRIGVQSGKHYPGMSGTVTKVSSKVEVHWDIWDKRSSAITNNSPNCLVLESVYQSPLYKALSEE